MKELSCPIAFRGEHGWAHLTTSQHLCCTLVGLINSGFVGISLLHDPVDLAILCIDLIAHIQGHVTEVPDDAAHLLQVFIHFIFSGIICYPADEAATDGHLLPFVHYTSRLAGHHSILIIAPGFFVSIT